MFIYDEENFLNSTNGMDDKQVVEFMKSLNNGSEVFSKIGPEYLRSNKEMVLEVFQNTSWGHFYKYISDELKMDTDIICAAIKSNYFAMQSIRKSQWHNSRVILTAFDECRNMVDENDARYYGDWFAQYLPSDIRKGIWENGVVNYCKQLEVKEKELEGKTVKCIEAPEVKENIKVEDEKIEEGCKRFEIKKIYDGDETTSGINLEGRTYGIWDNDLCCWYDYEKIDKYYSIHNWKIIKEKTCKACLPKELLEDKLINYIIYDCSKNEYVKNDESTYMVYYRLDFAEKDMLILCAEKLNKLVSEGVKLPLFVPIPDYAKVGDVFKTEDNNYLLVLNGGVLMPFVESTIEAMKSWYDSLSNIGKEVELNFNCGISNHVQVNAQYDFSGVLPREEYQKNELISTSMGDSPVEEKYDGINHKRILSEEERDALDAPNGEDILEDMVHQKLQEMDLGSNEIIRGHIVEHLHDDMYTIDGSDKMYFFQAFDILINSNHLILDEQKSRSEITAKQTTNDEQQPRKSRKCR